MPNLPEVAYHDDACKVLAGIAQLDPQQTPSQGVPVPLSLPFETPCPNAFQPFPSLAQSRPPLIPSLNCGASSSVSPPTPKFPEIAYHDDVRNTPVNITHLDPLQPSPYQDVSVPFSLPFETSYPNAIQTFPSLAQSPPPLIPSLNCGSSSSVSPPAFKLPELAYYDDVRKIPVDIKHLYPPQPSPSQSVPVPLSLPFEAPWPNAIQTFSSPAQSLPSLVSSPNGSLSVPSPPPKHPEVAYYDASWKLPVGTTHLFPPQQTWPGYGTYNAIQDFPSAAQSPPSLPPSNFATNDHPDLLNPQLYTTQSQEQQLEELLTEMLGMPRDNGNGPWNGLLQWPLQ